MSKYIPYSEKKVDFDAKAMRYIAKKIFEDIEDSEAYDANIIDSVGNEIDNLTEKNAWAFTHFDKFILALKQMVGQEKLRDLLSHYEWIQYMDPLFIINMDENTDFDKAREYLGKIITKIDDISYLPSELEHDKEYLEEDNLDFCKKVSKTLTIITFLLYALRHQSIPTSIDFVKNIIPSVETTFHIRPAGTFDECLEFCKKYKLIDSSNITNEGIRKIVSIAKDLVAGGLLTSKEERVENQTRNWKSIGEVKNA